MEEIKPTEDPTGFDPSFLEYMNRLEALYADNPHTISSSIGDRMLQFVNGKVGFAIIIRETRDSFLVSNPIVLSRREDTGEIFVKPLVPDEFTRILKSSIFSVSHVTMNYRARYFSYLLNEAKLNPIVYPDTIIEEMQSFIDEHDCSCKNETSPKNNKVSEADRSFMTPYYSKVKH